MPYFTRVLDAFEVAGFLSNEDRRSLLDSELDVDDLVSGWFTVAAAAMFAGGGTPATQEPQRAVLMEEAVPASPTPLPVAAAAPEACEKIVVEARRLVAVPVAYEKIVVEAVREHA